MQSEQSEVQVASESEELQNARGKKLRNPLLFFAVLVAVAIAVVFA